MWAHAASSAASEAAVIDIGSNSVRLVIYRLEGRAIWTVFNEKVLAGLGQGVATRGHLSPEGVLEARAALRRFKAVLDEIRPEAVYTAATAAVREATDGAAFLDQVREDIGLPIRVVSGEDEARYAALGVLAGMPDADGLVGDMGGSSLELIRVSHGQLSAGRTLPLGPFSLGAPGPLDVETLRPRIMEILRAAVPSDPVETLHAVGGAWRNLALIWMRANGYPLQIVQQFDMPARDVTAIAQFVARQSRGSLERIAGVSKKRVETLPYAAIVLDSLIEALNLKTICFSAYGLREGLLYEAMDPGLQQLDPLIAGCEALGHRQGAAETLGPALAEWLRPAFLSLPPVFGLGRMEKVISAAARLADLGARLHPDHRADLAFAQTLRAPIAGQSHTERAFIAAAVFARYGGGMTLPEPEISSRILGEDLALRARQLGLAMRLGCDLSARSADLLGRTRLCIDTSKISLSVAPDWADILLGEQTRKRANAFAQSLNLQLEMGPQL